MISDLPKVSSAELKKATRNISQKEDYEAAAKVRTN